jgi:hypothetical protein
MANPIVFISRNRVKEGMLDNFRIHYLDNVPLVESGKVGTLVQLAYVNEAANEVDIIHVFPNSESLDLQLLGADERSTINCLYIEPTSIEIYGTPSNYAIDTMKKVVGSSIELCINPQFIDGFIRSRPGLA